MLNTHRHCKTTFPSRRSIESWSECKVCSVFFQKQFLFPSFHDRSHVLVCCVVSADIDVVVSYLFSLSFCKASGAVHVYWRILSDYLYSFKQLKYTTSFPCLYCCLSLVNHYVVHQFFSDTASLLWYFPHVICLTRTMWAFNPVKSVS